jgi:hypothetical protein
MLSQYTNPILRIFTSFLVDIHIKVPSAQIWTISHMTLCTWQTVITPQIPIWNLMKTVHFSLLRACTLDSTFKAICKNTSCSREGHQLGPTCLRVAKRRDATFIDPTVTQRRRLLDRCDNTYFIGGKFAASGFSFDYLICAFKMWQIIWL